MKPSTVCRFVALLGVLLLQVTFARPAAAQDRLPNLRALPASDLYVVVNASGSPELRFSATSWNSGVGPFELRARDPGSCPARPINMNMTLGSVSTTRPAGIGNPNRYSSYTILLITTFISRGTPFIG